MNPITFDGGVQTYDDAAIALAAHIEHECIVNAYADAMIKRDAARTFDPHANSEREMRFARGQA